MSASPDFQSLFESAPGCYLVLSPDLTIVAASDSYISTTMTKRENILGHNIFTIFPDNPDDTSATGVSKLRASLNYVLTNKATHTMAVQKYDIRKADNSFEERYWSPLNKPVFDKENKLVYIIHRVEDVTEFMHLKKNEGEKSKTTDDLRKRLVDMEMEIYKRAQEIQEINDQLEQKVIERTQKLSDSERRFRNILDAMMEGVQIMDFNWRYMYVNDSLTKYSKYTEEELIGYSLMEKYPGVEETETFRILKKSMDERVPQHVENEFLFPDNTKGWFELSIQPVPEGLFILSIDITKRKQVEMENAALNEELEAKIIQRTAQLETVNKELEAFSYSVSHDLRAPLRAVNGYAKILEEDYEPLFNEEGKRLLSNIQYNAQKMGILIDDLLALSRLGKKELAISSIDMKDLSENVVNDLNKIMQHKAEIKIDKLHQAKADYGLMYQVLINLLSNAIKYSSKKEEPVVEMKSEVKEDHVVFSIRDNGAGFDMKYCDKLFGVFQRLHAMEEFDGTGVGLAITKRIVTKHNGNIWAEAEIDKGATFYFSLPKE